MTIIQLPISAANPDGNRTMDVLDVDGQLIVPPNTAFLVVEGSLEINGNIVSKGFGFLPFSQVDVTVIGIGKIGIIQ